jgi:hypothetical protein
LSSDLRLYNKPFVAQDPRDVRSSNLHIPPVFSVFL